MSDSRHTAPKRRVLLLTEDPELRAALGTGLPGAETTIESSPERALERLPGTFDVAVVDIRVAGSSLGQLTAVAPRAILLGDARGSASHIRSIRESIADVVRAATTDPDLRPRAQRPPAAIELAYTTNENQPAYEVLREGRAVSIGRDPTNTISFRKKVVSRFHAEIRLGPDGAEVHDRDSRHGTFVNGERVTGTRVLRIGDRVRLGKEFAPEIVLRRPLDRAEPSEPTSQLHGGEPSSERELKDLATLLDTFLQLRSDLVLDEVLTLVLTRAVEFSGADRGLILLAEEIRTAQAPLGWPVEVPIRNGPVLRLAMARNRDGSPVNTRELLISQKIPEEVIATGKGIMVEDLLAGDYGAHIATIEMGLRSVMCVPLRPHHQGREEPERGTLGVLYVDSKDRARPFSHQLLDALESLAREAAQAIDNAMLYEESLEKRRVDEELAIARGIQSNLLPPEHYASDWLELHGCSRPSRDVGGDVLDYYPLPERALGFVVGDVSGKGIPAAIFSAMLNGHFHSLSTTRDPHRQLPRLVEDLNRHLVTKSRLQRFVTFVFAVLEPSGTLSYINAGHNPPIVVRPQGATTILPPGGMILGMLEEATYQGGSEHLEPGDLLVLYSDGLTDARNPAGERFGLERLQETVLAHRAAPVSRLHDHVCAALATFANGVPPGDDVTLLILRRLQ